MRSQRPLQQVRLLQREREERNADEQFLRQKEEIIDKAQKLEKEKNQFRQKQQDMINKVKMNIGIITQNANKRKNEELKAENENQQILDKKTKIQDLKEKLDKKKYVLPLNY